MTKAGRVLEGKYRLEHLLGRGGMGSVWRARHLALGQPVAVKILERRHPDSDEARARFEREARVIARLRTPHVAQVHDQGVDEGTPYMVMEMLEGEDLGARLKSRGRLSLREVAAIAGQVARVLRLAHEAGVVHRDLKPSNVFLARIHDEEIVKVLDFGIAKSVYDASGVELTVTGALLGTLNYMSPEQLRDPRTVDWRTDLWSLGVIAFYALTGVEPFGARSFGETVGRICKDPLPVASQVASGVPPELDGFFERAFARDRNERFQSGREMADRLIGLALAATRDQDGIATTLLDTTSSRVANPWAPRNDPGSDSGVVLMPAFPTQATPAHGTPASVAPVSAPAPVAVMPARAPSPSVPPPSEASYRPRLESVPPQSVSPQSVPPQSVSPMALPARHDSGFPAPAPGLSTTSRPIPIAGLAPRARRRSGGARWVTLVAAIAGMLGAAVVVRAGLSWRGDGTGHAPTSASGGDTAAQVAASHAPSTQPAQSSATAPVASTVSLPVPTASATALPEIDRQPNDRGVVATPTPTPAPSQLPPLARPAAVASAPVASAAGPATSVPRAATTSAAPQPMSGTEAAQKLAPPAKVDAPTKVDAPIKVDAQANKKGTATGDAEEAEAEASSSSRH